MSCTVPLLLAVQATASGVGLSTPADAVAFVRVYGDLRVDLVEDWTGPRDAAVDVLLGTGSGFVVAPGLVLTNHHVVGGGSVVRLVAGLEVEIMAEVKRIEVAVGSGGAHGTFQASVVASDPDVDLAGLELTAFDLPYLPLGDSDALEAGQPVTILGYPFGTKVDLARSPGPERVPEVTVSSGALSATRRDDEGTTRYLQTDASIHPGSSGGPIIDADGYAIGVVRLKLAATEGVGFHVPINLVKDFLDANGLLPRLPAVRLPDGVLHALDWKGIRVELPGGFADRAQERLRVDTGDSGETLTMRIDRLATTLSMAALEEALLDGRAVPGFVPVPATIRQRVRGGAPSRVLGSARGTMSDGKPFRVEYALLDVSGEKVVARYLGGADDVAFNLGLLRRSLEGLEAVPLLTDEIRVAPEVALESVAFPGESLRSLLMPVDWTREPGSTSSCQAAPGTSPGLAASPLGDFTVVFRALSWDPLAGSLAELANQCGAGPGTIGPTFARGRGRLGVSMALWGVLLEHDGRVILLEAEAPEAKLPLLRDAFVSWVRGVAAGS